MNNPNNTTPQRSYKLPLLLFFAIAAYFLWTEHRAHVIEYLPFAFLFACIGIHFFMHGSHGGHGSHDHHSDEESNTENTSETQLTHQPVSEGSETDRSKQS